MNLNIYHRHFIVCGAGSGLGRAVAGSLLEEGAVVHAITRTPGKLDDMAKTFPAKLKVYGFDLTHIPSLTAFLKEVKDITFSGILINAGGPPAKPGMETSLEDWDEAYASLFRWKIFFAQKILKHFIENGYGRMLFIESAAVKEPIENLILSTSMRLAVVGFAKTFAQEVAKHNITMNILAPGFHETPAVERVFRKKSEMENISMQEAMQAFTGKIPAGRMGKADDFGLLAAFLLSPHAGFITGQTISIDGGMIKFIFG